MVPGHSCQGRSRHDEYAYFGGNSVANVLGDECCVNLVCVMERGAAKNGPMGGVERDAPATGSNWRGALWWVGCGRRIYAQTDLGEGSWGREVRGMAGVLA